MSAVPVFIADGQLKKKKRKKREQVFLTELKRSFTGYGSFFYKIADMPHMGLGTRFDLDKPFDAFVVSKSVAIAIEAKSMKSYAAFGRQIRSSQIKGLNKFTRHGGRGFVFLNIRSGTPRINRLIIFDWMDIKDRVMRGQSIKKKELESLPYIDGHKKRFNIRKWMQETTRK